MQVVPAGAPDARVGHLAEACPGCCLRQPPAPLVAGPLYASAQLAGAPFVIAGTLKIAYDLLLYRRVRSLKPPEESGM